MGFEQGWLSLYQMLASRPSGRPEGGPMPGAQSQFPFNRSYKLGIMIETPAAALEAVELARYSDFFSVGTNDLVQLRIRKGGGTELGKTVLATGSASADAPVLQVVAFDNTPAAGDGSNYNGDYYELLALGKGAGGNVVTAVGTFFAVQEIV